MTDNETQMVRTLAHTVWGLILGLGFVDGWVRQAGLDPEWAKGVAVTLSVAVVVFVAQQTAKRSGRAAKVAGTIVSGVNRPPAYTSPPPAG